MQGKDFPKSMFVFRKYSAIYKDLFVIEKKRIVAKLGRNILVEHIGSTAIDNLGGKNILDIIMGFKTAKPDNFKSIIEGLGYIFVERSVRSHLRLFFYRYIVYKGHRIRIHLHATKYGNKYWRERLAFRDYLRRHKDKAIEYAEVKKRAAKLAKGNKKVYQREKDLFTNAITRAAIIESKD